MRVARQRETLMRAQPVSRELRFSTSIPSGRSSRKQSATGCRVGFVVAHQRHQLDGFTGAVDAAIGVQEAVDRAGLRPSADPTIAQVEGGTADLEKAEVVVGTERGHDERLVATAAAQQPAGDAGDAARVGGRRGQLAVVAGVEPHCDVGQRLATCERADIDRQPVCALVDGEPEIGDENPVRRRLGIFILPQIGALGDR